MAKTKISLGDFFIQYIVRGMLLATVIHEYGHLFALRFIGVEGEIRSTVLNAVYPAHPVYGTDAIIFYGAGGVVQGIVFLLMMYRNKDAENNLINLWIAIQGFIYAAFEALTPRKFWLMGASLGLYVGLFVIVGYVVWKKMPVES